LQRALPRRRRCAAAHLSVTLRVPPLLKERLWGASPERCCRTESFPQGFGAQQQPENGGCGNKLQKEIIMRIVVKIGTSTLAHSGGRLNIRRVELLCKILSDLKNAGHALVLVTSGAIGMGAGKLGLPGRPQDMPGKQAAAAVGQCELMYFYDKLFSEYHHTVAQILLTAEDVRDPRRSAHLHDTLERLLGYGALPIVNENDAVATD